MQNDLLLQRIRELSHPLPVEEAPFAAKLKPLPEIKAVFFCVYGTMFVTPEPTGCPLLRIDSAALEEAFHSIDTGITDLSVCVGLIAQRLPEIANRHKNLRTQDGVRVPDIEIRAVWKAMLATLGIKLSNNQLDRLCIEYAIRTEPVWPVDGAVQMLQTLAKRQYKLGIAANAQFYAPLLFDALMEKSLMQLGFQDDLLFWSYQELRQKPDPDYFLRIVDYVWKRGQIAPEEILFVGSQWERDLCEAQNFGMKTALFTRGFVHPVSFAKSHETHEEKLPVHPDLILTNLSQLTEQVLQADVHV